MKILDHGDVDPIDTLHEEAMPVHVVEGLLELAVLGNELALCDPKLLIAQSRAVRDLLKKQGDEELADEVGMLTSRWRDGIKSQAEVETAVYQAKQVLERKHGVRCDDAGSTFRILVGLHQVPLDSYLAADHSLKLHPAYVSATSLFRTPELYLNLAGILAQHFPSGADIECVGCSNGKEAYSIALCLMASLGESTAGAFPIRGTDVNQTVIAQAQSGYVTICPQDLVNALDANMRPELLKRVLFGTGEFSALCPMAACLAGLPYQALDSGALESKSALLSGILELFVEHGSSLAPTIVSDLTPVSALPQRLTFECSDAREIVQARCTKGEPFVLVARNMLYHLCSTDGFAACCHMQQLIHTNAPLLLSRLPVGSMVVLGEIDLQDSTLVGVFQSLDLAQVPGNRFVFRKVR